MTDPTPTPLSLAEKAWNAVWQLSHDDSARHVNRRRQQVAAALRAAASQMEFVQDAQRLHPIAAELEGQVDG